MTVVTVAATVRRPPHAVFRFVATEHFANHPRWDPDVVEMRQTTPGPVGVGTTAEVVRRQGRRRVRGTATVTRYDPPRLAEWDVRFGAFRLLQRAEFSPVDDGTATLLTLSIDTRAEGPLKLVLPLLRGRFRGTMQRSLETIATLVTAGG